jgi:SAM-dependent methyltransferase
MIKPGAASSARAKIAEAPPTRFGFGENWRSFVATVSQASIAEAVRGLEKLFPGGELRGRSLLDIGCGSGLSMLAASRLGARSLAGVDIDPASVEAARLLLSRYEPPVPWLVRRADVFDLAPETDGVFDIVYSWGVLHHTGDLWTAVRRAASLVAPGGLLALGLYRRTPVCGFWRWEKRCYSRAGPATQAAVQALYKAGYCLGLAVTGCNPARYRRDYVSARGMDWAHDVHDWLGGYPYESAEPEQILAALAALGFAPVRSFARPAAIGGLLGSHCDEYVARRA